MRISCQSFLIVGVCSFSSSALLKGFWSASIISKGIKPRLYSESLELINSACLSCDKADVNVTSDQL